MADPRIKVRPPSDDPGRPPRGPAGVSTPKPPVIFVQPEIIAALDRIATAFEQTAAALAARPVDPPDLVLNLPMGVPCCAGIYRRGDPAVYRCNRENGHPAAEHDAGHVAEVDGKVLACSTCTEFNRRTTGMVCETCGTDYAKEV
ncbi:hypothetical protein APR04_003787 [Promicromonospora umidemergens]|uniref:Uncharacterized protein n=1 Tax=Promicromonospora umidemergens TaxID=629679 RepID=A0ABP8XK22_9MICO|nr:hypothetical protein [Promicromonospora umidemergens]MCP2284864.1 hypothetical protein [Promicromonospora umidemergens]